MKRILITGVNSYVGNRLEAWLVKEPDNYIVDKISLRDESWKDRDFSIYDSIVHVVGIAHRKETKDNKGLYYEVNRDLTFNIAQKAKQEGVPHFIFLSSMSVYGIDEGIIDEKTKPNPKSHYGKSKFEAEQLILSLENEQFKVAILRPPMIYGKGCKGNYRRLAKLARKVPIFPDIENKRSMIYIDNLSEFIKIIIDSHKNGLFFPQNSEYVNTTELVTLIATFNGKRIKLTKVFNPIINRLSNETVTKVFGDLVYSNKLASRNFTKSVIFIDFEESIKQTEE